MYDFIAISDVSKELKKSASLLKELDLHVLISGEAGVGKKTLAQFINNNSVIYNAKELQNDIKENAIELQNETIILDKIDTLTNIDLFLTWIEEKDIRVLATCKNSDLNNKLLSLFSITLEIPRLDQRKEDVKKLSYKFAKEASEVLGIKNRPSKLIINTKNNAHSLRKSIYFSYLFQSIGENEIMMLLEDFMLENMQGENSYRDFLYLFEAPLLRSAQKKYKSQVQMAKNLGLNRITLRKKIDTHKDLL